MSRPACVHQLVHTLSYGDAISGEALAFQRCMHEAGIESEIFAIHAHPVLKDKARDYRDLSDGFSGEVVLHYSLGSPLNDLYRRMRRARRTLVYHNLTPAKWFRNVNPRIVHDIEAGLRELPELCRISDRLLADSGFNAGELSALGFSAEVLELPIDPSRWNPPRNEGIYRVVAGDPGIHVLHVGRLAPNKCIEDIIKSFYFLHRKIEKRSRLWLVGIDIDTELYSFAMKRLVHELGLEQAVQFPGCLADSEVRSLYESCSSYVCMSEHEGFCLPVIEAMHFGLPVISYASSALPETIGSGGILLTEKRHAEIAELVALVHHDAALRKRLQDAGRERVRALSFEAFKIKVSTIFLSASSAERAAVPA